MNAIHTHTCQSIAYSLLSTGICPSAEDTSFIAIQVLSSTKLSSVKVGKNCPLDPLSNSGVPSRLIVVILPTTQLDEVKAYVNIFLLFLEYTFVSILYCLLQAEKNPSLDKKFEVDFGDDDPKSIQLRFDMYCAVDEYYFQNKDKQGVIDLLGDSTSPLKGFLLFYAYIYLEMFILSICRFDRNSTTINSLVIEKES